MRRGWMVRSGCAGGQRWVVFIIAVLIPAFAWVTPMAFHRQVPPPPSKTATALRVKRLAPPSPTVAGWTTPATATPTPAPTPAPTPLNTPPPPREPPVPAPQPTAPAA